MSQGLLVILSGFSGSGKGTLMKRLLEKYDNYALSVSVTTRSPRPGEREGVDYFFKTEEEFSRMIEDDAFLEYARYVNHSYGTPAAYVDEKLDSGKDVILEIEIQGALKVKAKRPDTVLIFVTPPSACELERRLTGRGTESQKVISQRMARAVEESESMDQYDYILVNDDLEECVDQLHAMIQAQHWQTGHQRAFIREIRQELKQSYAVEENEERK
ncbi:MAG: guanylate kinase [Bilifractor sp.]